jgi:hypothetical protein
MYCDRIIVFQTISPSHPPSDFCKPVRWKTAPCSEADSSGMADGGSETRESMDEGVDVFMVMRLLLRCQMSTQEAQQEDRNRRENCFVELPSLISWQQSTRHGRPSRN